MSPVTEGKLRLGGMALRNGLLVHGPTHWAAAVRDKQGNIQVASGRKPRVKGVDGVPGVRGVVRLGEAFAVIPLVKRTMPAAKLPFESPAVIGVAAAASLGGAQLRKRLRGVGGETAAAVDASATAPPASGPGRSTARRSSSVPATLEASIGATRCDPQRSCSLLVSAASVASSGDS